MKVGLLMVEWTYCHPDDGDATPEATIVLPPPGQVNAIARIVADLKE